MYPERRPDSAGTPVQPDIEASAAQALEVAHVAALRKLIERTPDRAGALRPLIEKLEAN